VGNVKKPSPLARGQMLLHNASGIKNGHLPAGEFHDLGAEGHVLFIENGSVKSAHPYSPFLYESMSNISLDNMRQLKSESISSMNFNLAFSFIYAM
jgi:hypothetical protein